MACDWCGDTHRSDPLCQRAQRGMTRRSFCFLFGAGLAAAAISTTAAPVDHWYLDADGRLHVEQANEWIVIEDSIIGPRVATFKTAAHLRKGQRVAISGQVRLQFGSRPSTTFRSCSRVIRLTHYTPRFGA